MWYAGYARTGKEFDVQQAIEDLGLAAWVARKMEFKRSGKDRRPRPHVSPYLPNYVFIECPAERYLDLLGVKHLASTLAPIPGKSIRYLQDFQSATEAEYTAQERRAASGEQLEQFAAGDSLQVIEGPLRGHLLTFRRTVENAHSLFPTIEGEMAILGRVKVDPLHVRAAE